MRSRRPWARAFAAILAGCITLAASRAFGQSVEGFPPPQSERVQQASRAALVLGTAWFGPPPFTTLTVRGVAAPGPPAPGVVEIPVRWLVIERDRSLERAAIAGVITQFWLPRAAPRSRFEEGLVLYTALRAIHERLEGSNFETVRFFGGFVPFPLRSVLLSPPVADPRPRVWRFEELPADPEVFRTVRGLQTLERYVGWPAMLQAVAAVRAAPGPLDASALAVTLSAIRGADIRRLVDECLKTGAVFDYAIENVRSVPVSDGWYESTLTIGRRGSAVFASTLDEDSEPAMPLLVRFSDGTELREWFDGAAASSTLVYTAKSPVVYAAVDPDLVLLLDVDRTNNSFAAVPPRKPLALRLALHWMSWLQQTVLAYTALV